jgi:ABC-type Fe3+ transport system permease subunit
VTWPFLKPLLLGALLAGLFRSLYQWITRRLGDRRSLGAVVTLLILFILVVPHQRISRSRRSTSAQHKRSSDSVDPPALGLRQYF